MKPLLLEKESERKHLKGTTAKPFSYDYQTDMNMRNGKPFIEYGSGRTMELSTKTETFRERDDENPDYQVDLLTKTDASRERDDEEIFFYEGETLTHADRERDDEERMLLESETITKVNREGVDDDPSFMLEMYSKTFEQRERDDEEDLYYYKQRRYHG